MAGTAEVFPPRTGGSGRALPASGARLAEVLAGPAADGAAAGFVLAVLARPGRGGPDGELPERGPAAAGSGGRAGPVLWLQDRLSRRETGRPYLPGLGGGGAGLLLAALARPADVLAAAEEGLACPALAAVVAEVWGDPPVLDFTATRRLAVRAEAAGLPCWLIRQGPARPGLSAARERWRVVSLPSAPHPDDPRAPGDPRWRAELLRARDGRPGVWVVRHDRAADRLDLAAADGDGALAAPGGTAGRSALR